MLNDFPGHHELKRGISPSAHRKRDDEGHDDRTFFERNQLFNPGRLGAFLIRVRSNANYSLPGVFMVILGTLLLLTIIAVAINVLSGLTISYKAFAKEMGPAAQKKQQ